MRAIVDELERVVRVAVLAQRRFRNPPAFHLDGQRIVADVTQEETLAHFRQERRCPNDHSAYGDKLVNVLRVEGAHALRAQRIVRTHLDLVLEGSLRVAIEEHLVCCYVEGWYDLLRVAYQLAIDVRIELLQVVAVYVEVRFANYTDLNNYRKSFYSLCGHPHITYTKGEGYEFFRFCVRVCMPKNTILLCVRTIWMANQQPTQARKLFSNCVKGK